MIGKLISERNLPALKSREEMLEILQREEYGFVPEKPEKTEFFTKEQGEREKYL